MSARDFPEDAVLIARGKYSTLTGEKRAALRQMRDELEGLVGCAGRVLRSPEDIEFVREQVASANRFVERVQASFGQIEILQAHLDELKPLAWGGKDANE